MLIRPMWIYSIHVTPFTNRNQKAAVELLDTMTNWAFPKLARHSNMRARRILGIEDANIRRRIQALSMVERMEEVGEHTGANGNPVAIEATNRDAAAASTVRAQSDDLGDPTAEQVHRWMLLESSRNRKRNVGVHDVIAPHSLWELPTRRHSACAANWIFGRYLKNKSAVCWFMGTRNYETADSALPSSFEKPEWSEAEKELVCHALKQMSGLWAVPLKHRRLEVEHAALHAELRRHWDGGRA